MDSFSMQTQHIYINYIQMLQYWNTQQASPPIDHWHKYLLQVLVQFLSTKNALVWGNNAV